MNHVCPNGFPWVFVIFVTSAHPTLKPLKKGSGPSPLDLRGWGSKTPKQVNGANLHLLNEGRGGGLRAVRGRSLALKV